ncbi:hypothetical protein OAI84_00585 [bacterium]|nr:hypothetical protein [bacterium]
MSFNLTKMLKKLKGSNLVLVVAAAALFIAICNYSKGKDTYLDGLENTDNDAPETYQYASAPSAPTVNNPQVQAGCCANSGGSPQPSQPLGQNEVYGSANGIHTSVQGLPPACSREQVVDPKELLPRDNNNAWSKLNPQGAGGLDNGQFLQAGYHVGIDTVGQSLRNANLQLRSEPANPQLNIGPWNNTTIGPDFNRRPLEIGCGVSN